MIHNLTNYCNKEQLTKLNQYFLSCIDDDTLLENDYTPEEHGANISYIMDRFTSEYAHEITRQQALNRTKTMSWCQRKAFAEWLKGLALNTVYYYWDICEVLGTLGILDKTLVKECLNGTQKSYPPIVYDWFEVLTDAFFENTKAELFF